MASSITDVTFIQLATRQVNLYFGLFVFITGLFGNLLNTTVFSTLKTFKKTTCSFYLITTSIFNIAALFVILIRVIYEGFNFGLSYTTIVCKFRFFIAQYGFLMSLTSMCLATIDQFTSMTKYKQWNQLNTAHRFIGLASVFWFVVSVFSFIYYDVSGNACVITNPTYTKYFSYFYTPVLLGVLPLSLMIIFSVLAFFKIRTIASRQMNIIRLSRDRQLTKMTLLHVLFIIITSVPFLTFYVSTFIINITDPIQIAQNQLIYAATVYFYYTNFSWSFYIYCCVSRRFRKQVKYVLIDIHLNRWRRKLNIANNNRVVPYPIVSVNDTHPAKSAEYNGSALF